MFVLDILLFLSIIHNINTANRCCVLRINEIDMNHFTLTSHRNWSTAAPFADQFLRAGSVELSLSDKQYCPRIENISEQLIGSMQM